MQEVSLDSPLQAGPGSVHPVAQGGSALTSQFPGPVPSQDVIVPKKYFIYHGDNLLKKNSENKWLIEGWLAENDVIMLAGSEKSGKSILALQMAAALSSGGMFLGKFKAEKSPVAYFQFEGKKDETATRLENMRQEVDFDQESMVRVYRKFLPLDIPDCMKEFREILGALPIRPKVIFLDCLYMAMSGDLNDNKDTRAFIGAVSPIVEEFGFTVILIHHAKRDEYDEKGNKKELGDKSIYGSVFWRGWVDHIIWLDMNHDKTRKLACTTQRSGQVAESEKLVLVQPSPLFFKIQDKLTGSEETCLHHLKRKSMTKKELMEKTKLSDWTITQAITKLLGDQVINIVDLKASHTKDPAKVYGVLPKGVEV